MSVCLSFSPMCRLFFFFFCFLARPLLRLGSLEMYYKCVLPKEICSYWSPQTSEEREGGRSRWQVCFISSCYFGRFFVTGFISLVYYFLLYLFFNRAREKKERYDGFCPIFCTLSIACLACTKPKRMGQGDLFACKTPQFVMSKYKAR